MTKQSLIIVGVLILVATSAGIVTYKVMMRSSEKVEMTNSSTEIVSQRAGTVTVEFTDSGFDKQQYTIKTGSKLVIKNNSSQVMQFSSDDHPTHRLAGELNAKAIASGESTALTPVKTGTFGVHDHVRSQFTSTVEVTE